MPKITLFNPEQTATVYDSEGRVVGGAERVELEALDKVGQAAVDAGLLVREEKSDEETKPGAKDAGGEDAPPLPTDEKSEQDADSGASSRAKRR